MKKRVHKEKLFNIISILIFTFVVAFFYIRKSKREKFLSSNDVMYSIGKITGVQTGAKVSPWFVYEFYNGKDFEISQKYLPDSLSSKYSSIIKKEYVGKKYLIKYSIEQPIYNEIYLNKPIEDSLTNCLKCTWPTPDGASLP